jgi:hypothetical protein
MDAHNNGRGNHLKVMHGRMIQITRHPASHEYFSLSLELYICMLSSKLLYDSGCRKGHEVLPFPTAQMCEAGFLKIYTSTKTTFHNRLNAGAGM